MDTFTSILFEPSNGSIVTKYFPLFCKSINVSISSDAKIIEALQLMPVGSKFKLFVPQNLAYGVRGGGQAIKPYSALIFEVELLEIEK